MDVIALLALLFPIAATARWARQRGADSAEVFGAGFCGLAVATAGIWLAATPFGFHAVTIIVGSVGAATIVIALSTPARTAERDEPEVAWRALAMTALVLCIAIAIPFTPYGAERADGVHRMSMTDWEKHLMFATELTTSDAFPMANPFLPTSGGSPYYAGYHMLAAVAARPGGPSAVFPALMLLTLITAAAVPLVAFVFARSLTGCSRKAKVAAVAATLLGGFDMFVLGIRAALDTVAAWPLSGGLAGLRAIVPSINPDFWIHHNERQFYAPYRAVLWAPQHVFAALVAVMVIGWLQFGPQRVRIRDGIVCGLLLAGVATASAYVALAAAVWLAAAYLGASFSRRQAPWRMPEWPAWSAAGASAVLFAMPIFGLFAGASGARLQLDVSAAGTLANGALATSILGDSQLARILDTPAVLAFDLGIVGLLAVLAIRGRRAGNPAAASGIIAGAGAVILLVTFLRPPVGGPNNLWARGLLIVWFAAAALAAEAWCSMPRRRWMVVGALCAALYAPYAMLGATLEGWLFWATPPADHEVAAWLEANAAPSDTIAYAPEEGPTYLTYWARRRVAFDDARLAGLFGASAAEIVDAEERLRAALGSADRNEAVALLRPLRADWLVYRSDGASFESSTQSECLRTVFRAAPWTVARVQACD